MTTINVSISLWVPGNGISYTSPIDPMTVNTMSDLHAAAKAYAEGWMENEQPLTDGSDYIFTFYDTNGAELYTLHASDIL